MYRPLSSVYSGLPLLCLQLVSQVSFKITHMGKFTASVEWLIRRHKFVFHWICPTAPGRFSHRVAMSACSLFGTIQNILFLSSWLKVVWKILACNDTLFFHDFLFRIIFLKNVDPPPKLSHFLNPYDLQIWQPNERSFEIEKMSCFIWICGKIFFLYF